MLCGINSKTGRRIGIEAGWMWMNRRKNSWMMFMI